jgi:hypothetical protein
MDLPSKKQVGKTGTTGNVAHFLLAQPPRTHYTRAAFRFALDAPAAQRAAGDFFRDQ